MPDVPMDNCMHCGKEYALIAENACIQIFLKALDHCFIQAQCPHCEGWTRMFVGLDTTCEMIDMLPIYVYSEPNDEIRAAVKRVNGEPPKQTSLYHDDSPSELPDIPPQIRRELWDWMRDHDD